MTPQPEFVPYRVQTVPFAGDYFRTRQGRIYQALKINPKYCLSRDEAGDKYNVPYDRIAETGIEDQGWEQPKMPRPGELVRVKSSSGIFRKTWFRQYSTSTLFVVTKTDGAAKVSFAPLGGEGMPENGTGYTIGSEAVEIVPLSEVLK